MRPRLYLLHAFVALAIVIVFCEYLVHYVAMLQCGWPSVVVGENEEPVRAIFISDTHLLGSRNGFWLDAIVRDWQLTRMFKAAMDVHKPEAVFILGDVFEEGQWENAERFKHYTSRFQAIFAVPKKTHLQVVVGNHDIGFHYDITPYLNHRFEEAMNAPSVNRISIRGNHFILINSMALEGDHCFLCKPTELAVKKLGDDLSCAKNTSNYCNTTEAIPRYSRPILLQHFPLYRESDGICDEIDEAPPEIKFDKFKEQYDCLSKTATKQILDALDPRLVVDGHTHHGCRTVHRGDILEVTVPSLSWRNKNNPSILLGTFSPDSYAVSKCFMPVSSTVAMIYVLSVIFIAVYLAYKYQHKRVHRSWTALC